MIQQMEQETKQTVQFNFGISEETLYHILRPTNIMLGLVAKLHPMVEKLGKRKLKLMPDFLEEPHDTMILAHSKQEIPEGVDKIKFLESYGITISPDFSIVVSRIARALLDNPEVKENIIFDRNNFPHLNPIYHDSCMVEATMLLTVDKDKEDMALAFIDYHNACDKIKLLCQENKVKLFEGMPHLGLHPFYIRDRRMKAIPSIDKIKIFIDGIK